MAELARFMTAMVTPYTAENEVDYKKARALARHLVQAGNEGVVLAGTTGESPLLSDDEKARLWEEVRDELGETYTVVAGAGTVDTHHSVLLTRRAEAAGADAILAVAPYYLKPSQEGLYQHFRAIAESTHLPVIVYNVPARTGVNVALETMVRLSDIPNIVGDKEANGDLTYCSNLIAARPDFKIWSGNDSDNFFLWCLGAYGAISVTGHFVAARQQEMRALIDAGRVAEAAAIHRELVPVTAACFLNGNPSSVRYAIRQFGFDIGAPRLPVVEPGPAIGEQIMNELRKREITVPEYTAERQVAGAPAGGC